MKKVLYTFSLIICLQQLTIACSCIDTGSFCESVSFLEKFTDLDYNVVQVIVAEQNDTGVKVTVLQTFYGDATAGTMFTIRNGNELDCSVSTDALELGKTYIFALEFPASQIQQVSNCGTFYLRVENGKAKGNIAPGIDEVSLDDFVRLLNCGNYQGPGLPTFSLNPTLVNNEELTAFPNFWLEPNDVEIQVFDIIGRTMLNAKLKNFAAFEPIEISLKDWSAGVYYCQFIYLGKKQTIRIVKVN